MPLVVCFIQNTIEHMLRGYTSEYDLQWQCKPCNCSVADHHTKGTPKQCAAGFLAGLDQGTPVPISTQICISSTLHLVQLADVKPAGFHALTKH